MGIRDFSLNSEKGVLTPSWRKMGSKKCHHFSEQINLFCCIKFRYANFNTLNIKVKVVQIDCSKNQVWDMKCNKFPCVYLINKKEV